MTSAEDKLRGQIEAIYEILYMFSSSPYNAALQRIALKRLTADRDNEIGDQRKEIEKLKRKNEILLSLLRATL